MRRKDREITSLPEIREIVNSATECHLALNDDGSLHVRRADGSTKDVASGEVSLRF